MNIIETNLQFKEMTTRKKTKRIILHHSEATNCTAEDIHRWHLANGWSGAGYHFLVRKDGSIYRMRPEDKVGAHAGGSNSDSIGICFEGRYMEEDMPQKQIKAGQELVAFLKEKYEITLIQAHRDVCSTSCPGDKFPFDEIASGCENVKEEPKSPCKNVISTVTVKVNSLLRIREGAGTNFNVIGQYNNGEKVDIYEKENNWGRTEKGWICLDYTVENANKQSNNKLGLYQVNTPSGLNVREGAGTNHRIVKTYANGTRFDTFDIVGDWALTPSGYVNLKYCKLIKLYY